MQNFSRRISDDEINWEKFGNDFLRHKITLIDNLICVQTRTLKLAKPEAVLCNREPAAYPLAMNVSGSIHLHSAANTTLCNCVTQLHKVTPARSALLSVRRKSYHIVITSLNIQM
jgi:hypothetical protein